MSDKEKKSDKEGWRKNLLSGLSGAASNDDDEKVIKFNTFKKMFFESFVDLFRNNSLSSLIVLFKQDITSSIPRLKEKYKNLHSLVIQFSKELTRRRS
jgi:hypothetical protein